MITVDAVRSRVRNSFETIVADLVDLVAIPSVSASSHDQSQVARSAEHVADLLRQISDDLGALIEGIEAAACKPDSPEYTAPGTAHAIAPGAVGAITDVMARGNAGRARIPGKHGGAPRRYAEVQVLVPDAAGELGRLFSDVGAAGINIEDFSLEHSAGQSAGVAALSVVPSASQVLQEALDARGWRVVVVG